MIADFTWTICNGFVRKKPYLYVLMTNHVDLLWTPETADRSSRLMKAFAQRFVQYINLAYRRSGMLREVRFRSCLVDAETYLLGCQRSIGLDPVRDGRVAHPAEYPWISYGGNAHGGSRECLKPHSVYLACGKDGAARCEAYRELFRYQLGPGLVDEIRDATNSKLCLGSEPFKTDVAEMLGRRLISGSPGRPRNSK